VEHFDSAPDGFAMTVAPVKRRKTTVENFTEIGVFDRLTDSKRNVFLLLDPRDERRYLDALRDCHKQVKNFRALSSAHPKGLESVGTSVSLLMRTDGDSASYFAATPDWRLQTTVEVMPVQPLRGAECWALPLIPSVRQNVSVDEANFREVDMFEQVRDGDGNAYVIMPPYLSQQFGVDLFDEPDAALLAIPVGDDVRFVSAPINWQEAPSVNVRILREKHTSGLSLLVGYGYMGRRRDQLAEATEVCPVYLSDIGRASQSVAMTPFVVKRMREAEAVVRQRQHAAPEVNLLAARKGNTMNWEVLVAPVDWRKGAGKRVEAYVAAVREIGTQKALVWEGAATRRRVDLTEAAKDLGVHPISNGDSTPCVVITPELDECLSAMKVTDAKVSSRRLGLSKDLQPVPDAMVEVLTVPNSQGKPEILLVARTASIPQRPRCKVAKRVETLDGVPFLTSTDRRRGYEQSRLERSFSHGLFNVVRGEGLAHCVAITPELEESLAMAVEKLSGHHLREREASGSIIEL
jgi:hypothetical protein